MAATYLVRMAIDGELLGIFWADSIDELAIIIDDEAVDPGLCEIKKIKNGGFCWPTPIEVKVPLATIDYDAEEMDETDHLGDAIEKLTVPSVSWQLWEDLMSNKGWKKLKDIWDGKSVYGY